MKIVYDKVAAPVSNCYLEPVDLNAQTMEEHRKNVINRIKQEHLDVLVIYADREHGANFAYLTGFEPRFEEALLILHREGSCYYLLGNENLKMAQYSFLPGRVVHVPHFSLPCQPMETDKTLAELIECADIHNGMRIGCVGWKLFTGKLENNQYLIDIPAFIVDALRAVDPDGEIVNADALFLDPENGLRTLVNANELAHYEFGAGLASAGVLAALNEVEPGKTEMQIARCLQTEGQPNTVTTICATGGRFTNAVVFPRAKKIACGDKFSVTLGLRGGLSSRAAYVAGTKEDIPESARDYVEKVAIPYYRAVVTWLEMMDIGVVCGDIYRKMEEVLPKETYHWVLNPGHYTNADEWSSSPLYPDSTVQIRSGMLLQLDIIPSVPGYGGVSAEDGIAIADETLRQNLREQYPKTWERIQKRRTYIRDVLGINLKEAVLPMSDILGYLRPLLLRRECALRNKDAG